MNSGKIALALRALADAFEEGAQDSAGTPPEPQKQTRGRKAKGEADGVALPVAAAQTGTAPAATPAVTEDDPFADKAPAVPTATLDQVRKALTDLRAASDQAAALKVLKDAGGADNLNDLKPEKYGVVVAAVNVQLRIIESGKPVPVTETDPFASPGTPAAATAPAAKALTLEDVKAAVVAAGKRTAQDTVQAVVMSHGGKATDPATNLPKPSLKALAEKDYAAVIAAIQALPTTKT